MGKFDEQERQKTLEAIKEMKLLVKIADSFNEHDTTMIQFLQFQRYVAESVGDHIAIYEFDLIIADIKKTTEVTNEKRKQLLQVLKDLGHEHP